MLLNTFFLSTSTASGTTNAWLPDWFSSGTTLESDADEQQIVDLTGEQAESERRRAESYCYSDWDCGHHGKCINYQCQRVFKPIFKPRGCPYDILTCPDGTQVGRDRFNNCAWEPCPTQNTEPACGGDTYGSCQDPNTYCVGTFDGYKCSSFGPSLGRPRLGSNWHETLWEPYPAQKACTRDMKICPDGSYVGRDGFNNCAWEPCPTQNTEPACGGDTYGACQDPNTYCVGTFDGYKCSSFGPSPTQNTEPACGGDTYGTCQDPNTYCVGTFDGYKCSSFGPSLGRRRIAEAEDSRRRARPMLIPVIKGTGISCSSDNFCNSNWLLAGWRNKHGTLGCVYVEGKRQCAYSADQVAWSGRRLDEGEAGQAPEPELDDMSEN